ncbi:hypothetical protein V3C99_013245 [Haemonchus contortus]
MNALSLSVRLLVTIVCILLSFGSTMGWIYDGNPGPFPRPYPRPFPRPWPPG